MKDPQKREQIRNPKSEIPETESKLTEDLLENNQRLQAIFDASPVAILALDLHGKVILWSAAAERIFGWAAKEVVGRFNPLVPDEGQEEFWGFFSRVLHGKGYLQQDVRRLTKGGSLMSVSISAAPLRDIKGEIIGAMGLIEDITERVKTYEALLESEERYRTLLETMNDGFTVQNEKGEITYANDGFLEMIGYSREEVLGHQWNYFLDEYNQKVVRQQLKSRKKGAKNPYELEWKTKGGKKICTVISPQPFFDVENTFISSSTVITDITRLKKTQIELQRHENELKIQGENLEETNAALRVLLKRRDQDKELDKKELEEKILSNIKETIMPTIMKLKRELDGKKKSYVDMLELNLKDIASPFSRSLSFKYLNLTPTELQVANFIKQGMRTKEIADFMNLSPKTIEGHRKNMRKKLGIANSKINLRTQLLAIEED